MSSRCANPSCCTRRISGDGTMFRLDIELGDLNGRKTRKSAYIWLCSTCAGLMKPTVEVADHTVRVRLSARPEDSAGTSSLNVN